MDIQHQEVVVDNQKLNILAEDLEDFEENLQDNYMLL